VSAGSNEGRVQDCLVSFEVAPPLVSRVSSLTSFFSYTLFLACRFPIKGLVLPVSYDSPPEPFLFPT